MSSCWEIFLSNMDVPNSKLPLPWTPSPSPANEEHTARTPTKRKSPPQPDPDYGQRSPNKKQKSLTPPLTNYESAYSPDYSPEPPQSLDNGENVVALASSSDPVRPPPTYHQRQPTKEETTGSLYQRITASEIYQQHSSSPDDPYPPSPDYSPQPPADYLPQPTTDQPNSSEEGEAEGIGSVAVKLEEAEEDLFELREIPEWTGCEDEEECGEPIGEPVIEDEEKFLAGWEEVDGDSDTGEE